MVGVSAAMTKSDALKLEYRVKCVPAGKKINELNFNEKISEVLIRDVMMKNRFLCSIVWIGWAYTSISWMD